MSSPTVIAVDYRDSTTDPWPRLLRFIAIITLVYAAAFVAMIANSLRWMWPFQRIPTVSASPAEYWASMIFSVAAIVVGGCLIWGAAKLLRGVSPRLVVVASGSLLILWPTALGSIAVIRARGENFWGWLISSFLFGAETYIFLLLIILLLRARRLRCQHGITTRLAASSG